MSMELTIPTSKDLEGLSPAERWDVEEGATALAAAAREFNDEELRRWVEVEGKTQAEIAELVGRSQSQISRRCARLGLVSGRTSSGQKRSMHVHTSDDDLEAEVVEGEVVEEELLGERNGVSQDACFVDPHEFADWNAVLKAVKKELKDLFSFAKETPHLDKADAMEKLAAQLLRESKRLRKELQKETR